MQLRFKFFLLAGFALVSLSAKAQVKYGDMAPEIALPSASGDTLRLSSLKGKVVLLDFWASWCKPCRVSNKELVKIYPKYKDKGFEIFGVSLDDDPGEWKDAVKKDKINWLQVNDPGRFESKVALRWDIFAIPTSYLIDKTGKLVAMDLTAKALEKALKELL